jgi:hypothetical protein
VFSILCIAILLSILFNFRVSFLSFSFDLFCNHLFLLFNRFLILFTFFIFINLFDFFNLLVFSFS